MSKKFALKVELQLGALGWTDVTSDVQGAVSITRGQSAEGSRADAGKCSMRLDNISGDYSPRNPSGQWYGHLGRNTPLRVSAGPVGGSLVVRFYGEVPSWPPGWNLKGNVRWVDIEAAGIIRRLGQGAPPVRSALRRTIEASGPAAYWPGEDGVLSAQASSARSGVAPLTVTGNVEFKEVADYVSFAGVSTRYGTTALPDVSGGGSLAATVPAAATTATGSAWTVHAVVLVDATTLSGDLVVLEWTTDGGTYTRWELKVTATSRTQVVGYTSGGASTLLIDEPSASASFLHYAVSAEQDGGNVTVTLYRELSTLNAVFAGSLGGVTAVEVNPTGVTSSIDMPSGHIAVWASGTLPLARTAFFDSHGRIVREALRSWQGEEAVDRIERLCAEQGVPVHITRGAGPSFPMGPQGPGTFLDLLEECAAVDMGYLFESRDQMGLAYRSRDSLYNQTPTPIAYAGQLHPPFAPDDSADHVRNDIEVKRPEGGSARAVLDEGPLSVQPPPEGIGVYDESVTVNVASDDYLPDIAGWRLNLAAFAELPYEQRRRLAIHEAAHAVAAIVLGSQVAWIDMRLVDGRAAGTLTRGVDPHTDAVVALAGYEASGGPLRYGREQTHDTVAAYKLVGRHGLARADLAARELLLAHQGAILALADVLMVRHRLTGEQVAEVVRPRVAG